jgi:lysozyme
MDSIQGHVMTVCDLHKRFAEWAEDRRNYPYEDSVGKLTIGIGRNLEDNGLSDEEVDTLFYNDHESAYKDAEGFEWFDDLDPIRRMVVVDMIFNMGLPRFLGFINTIKALEAGDYPRAAREMQDSRWYRQVGRRSKPLVRAMATGHLDYG